MHRFEGLRVIYDDYDHSPGGEMYCTVLIGESLEERGDSKGVQLADDAKTKIEYAQKCKVEWEKHDRNDQLTREGARRIDDKIDDLLGNIVQTLEAQADAPVDTESSRLAEEMRDELFPDGVTYITTQKFDDQHLAVNGMVERFREDFPDHLAKLNLEEMVDHLEEYNEQFGERLREDDDQISYDEVEAAKVEADEAFYRLIAHVMAEYGDDLEELNRILEPFAEQRERARRYFKRRGTVPEIDPETGEPVEPTGESPEGDGQNDGGSPQETDDGESESTGENDGSGDGESEG
jgi:hypothetical protein